MKSPADPLASGSKQTSEPIDIKHQLGVMRTAVVVPQPGQPRIPTSLPPQKHSLAALNGMRKK